MKFISETVAEFFGRQRIQYTIPAYQRAYSWEEFQWQTFLEDLIEHKNSDRNNPYCYGNIMLETVAEGKRYEIIDGQQRITTLSIFIRSLLNVFRKRIEEGFQFTADDNEPITVEDEEDVYFKDHGVVKLRPTQYDIGCFDSIIIDNHDDFDCITPSQTRMLKAKSYFSQELAMLSNDDLISIFKVVQSSIVNRIELTGKKESALMFELQNNRGKDLTNLEKLKSFLMYQLYVYSQPDETDSNIEYVSNNFDPIYAMVNQMALQFGDDEDGISSAVNEDSILIYHSYAYSNKHFNYRNLNDIVDEFKAVPLENKVSWIRDYSLTLRASFAQIQEIVSMKDNNLERIKKMKIPYFVYPFLIKGARNKASISELFKLMEVLSFRYKLIGSRADIRGRLNDLIKEYDGDNVALGIKLKKKMEESYYWSDKRLKETLNGNMYQNNMIYYFLWEYEQDLQRKGYFCGNLKIEEESIEHIAPQTEPEEMVTSGYEVDINGLYAKDFRENYLNKLGNLMLISQPHNSSIGNKPFSEKMESYIANPLLQQQREIRNFVEDENNPVWNCQAIDKRHEKMLDFAMRRWSFDI